MSGTRNELKPGLGHNRGPGMETVTSSILLEETQDYRTRATELIRLASKAVVLTPDDAGKVQLLGVKLKDLSETIEQERTERGQPYLRATRLINSAYKAISDDLDKSLAAMRGMLTEFKRRQQAEAEAQRAIAEAEARQRQEEAAAAAAKLAEGEGDPLAELEAREAAEAAQRRAEAIRPAPIPTVVGGVGTRPERHFEVTSLLEALRWLVKVNRAAVTAAVTELVRKQLALIPVEQIGTAPTPGVKAWIENVATIRRR